MPIDKPGLYFKYRRSLWAYHDLSQNLKKKPFAKQPNVVKFAWITFIQAVVSQFSLLNYSGFSS